MDDSDLHSKVTKACPLILPVISLMFGPDESSPPNNALRSSADSLESRFFR